MVFNDYKGLRNTFAFWILGLCNEFAYVIMLSAAEDIIDKESGTELSPNDTICKPVIIGRDCQTMSTGLVLLADILPAFFIKTTFPFFMQRIPFGIRHLAVVSVQAGSFLMVALSKNVATALAGVVLASMGLGLGEISYIALSSHYSKGSIAAWSSGTGAAGVIAAFAYAGLTEPMLAGLSPSVALLSMLVVPVIFATAYWFVLVIPSTVYSPSWNPRTWIVPGHATRTDNVDAVWESEDDETGSIGKKGSFEGKESIKEAEEMAENKEVVAKEQPAVQRHLSMIQKLKYVVPMLKYIIPLAIVYFAEYIINQGLVQLMFFDCSHGMNLSINSQYRWYQVLYRLGTFLSRTSVSIVKLPFIILMALPFIQSSMAVLFFFDALYLFIPHIAIVFVIILVEGYIGGSAYANTFAHVYREVEPSVREFSLSIAATSDVFGIVAAGFASIPVHNWICKQPL